MGCVINMGKSIYARRVELYREWTILYDALSVDLSFDEYQKIHEKEDAIYKRWVFYDKLLKRMEVMKYSNKKKKCYQKEDSTNKGSQANITVRKRF